MLKKLSVVAVILAVALSSCNQKKEVAEDKGTMCVESLYKSAADLVGQEITVTGVVNHVCQEDGRKIRIISGEKWIMGFAGETIDKFNEEKLLLEEVIVKGILKESRITAEDIAEMEKKHTDKLETTEEHNHDGAEHSHDGEEHNHDGDEHNDDGEEHNQGSDEHHVQDGDNIAKLKEKLAASEHGYIANYSILVSEVSLKNAEVKEEAKDSEVAADEKKEE